MKKAIILNVGTEILKGEIKETNSYFFSQQLNNLGILVTQIMSISDDKSDFINRLNQICTEKIDYIFISGGIGPTEDDLTREGIADFLNVSLKFDSKEWDYVKDKYKNSPYTKKKNKLCYFPEESKIFRSLYQTASAFQVKKGNIKIFILPGIPYEMKHLFQKKITPILKKENKQLSEKTLCFKLYGHKEVDINFFVKNLLEKENRKFHWGILSRNDGIFVKFYLTNENSNKIKEEKEWLTNQFNSQFKNDIYSYSNKDSLLTQVKNLIFKVKKTFSTVESCTSGSIGLILNQLKHISLYYSGTVIPYTKESKVKITKINPEFIKKTAVNEKTVLHLAQWGLDLFQSDICLSVSGLLGPTKQEKTDPPIGTIYFCLASKSHPPIIRQHCFSGSRKTIRQKATFFSLNMFRLFLKKFLKN